MQIHAERGSRQKEAQNRKTENMVLNRAVPGANVIRSKVSLPTTANATVRGVPLDAVVARWIMPRQFPFTLPFLLRVDAEARGGLEKG